MIKDKKIVVSACMAGINCKYDGGNNNNLKILKLLEEDKIVLVCPEELGGMSTPRIPSEQVNDMVVLVCQEELGGMSTPLIDSEQVNYNVLAKNGVDVTYEFNKGANEALKIAKGVNADIAILQQRSPSCGSKMVYDGSFSGKLIKGKGVTTKLFEENGIKVLTIDDI